VSVGSDGTALRTLPAEKQYVKLWNRDDKPRKLSQCVKHAMGVNGISWVPLIAACTASYDKDVKLYGIVTANFCKL
jgi:hypothetical protein